MGLLVSVIIPTYKRADMLPRAIRSVLDQTYKGVEVIVVDDNDSGSEDRKSTEKLMNSFAQDCRVKYIKHKTNRNGSAARNTGIENSSGSFLCFLDDDDYFLPGKIEKQVHVLCDSDYGACCCDYLKEGKRIILEEKQNYVEDILLLERTPQTSGIMFRREAIEALGGFDETYIRHQDYELLLRFFASGYRMKKINECLYVRDISAKLNIPQGDLFEDVKKKLLSEFNDVIETIEINKKGFKSRVYVKHYMALIKNYVKCKNYKKCFYYVFLSMKINFFFFLKTLLKEIKIQIGK